MAVLSVYEKRMLREKGEKREEPLPPPTPPISPIMVASVDPWLQNRASSITFGKQVLKDFPYLASRWANDYEASKD